MCKCSVWSDHHTELLAIMDELCQGTCHTLHHTAPPRRRGRVTVCCTSGHCTTRRTPIVTSHSYDARPLLHRTPIVTSHSMMHSFANRNVHPQGYLLDGSGLSRMIWLYFKRGTMAVCGSINHTRSCRSARASDSLSLRSSAAMDPFCTMPDLNMPTYACRA